MTCVGSACQQTQIMQDDQADVKLLADAIVHVACADF